MLIFRFNHAQSPLIWYFATVRCTGPSGSPANQTTEYDDLCQYEEIGTTGGPTSRQGVTIATTSLAEQQAAAQVTYSHYIMLIAYYYYYYFRFWFLFNQTVYQNPKSLKIRLDLSKATLWDFQSSFYRVGCPFCCQSNVVRNWREVIMLPLL